MARIPKQRKLPNPKYKGLHHKGINEKVQRALDAKHEQEQNEEKEVQQVNEEEENGEAEHKEE